MVFHEFGHTIAEHLTSSAHSQRLQLKCNQLCVVLVSFAWALSDRQRDEFDCLPSCQPISYNLNGAGGCLCPACSLANSNEADCSMEPSTSLKRLDSLSSAMYTIGSLH